MPESSANIVNWGLDVSRESLEQLKIYVGLLEEWQEKHNIIGTATEGQIWSRHIADSLQLVRLIGPGNFDVADLGSGGGIPGLILAIATGWHVDLFECNGKKCAFLREAIRRTGATARVCQERLGSAGESRCAERYQIVTARAFAPLPRLLEYSEPFLSAGAVGFFHKGQDVDVELTATTKYWKLNLKKHRSLTDSNGVILEVREAQRVQSAN